MMLSAVLLLALIKDGYAPTLTAAVNLRCIAMKYFHMRSAPSRSSRHMARWTGVRRASNRLRPGRGVEAQAPCHRIRNCKRANMRDLTHRIMLISRNTLLAVSMLCGAPHRRPHGQVRDCDAPLRRCLGSRSSRRRRRFVGEGLHNSARNTDAVKPSLRVVRVQKLPRCFRRRARPRQNPGKRTANGKPVRLVRRREAMRKPTLRGARPRQARTAELKTADHTARENARIRVALRAFSAQRATVILLLLFFCAAPIQAAQDAHKKGEFFCNFVI